MVADAVLPDTAFYMLEEFAGRMANAGNPRKDQVIWNIYSDTLTYKDFEHMSYDREGNEARVSTEARATFRLKDFVLNADWVEPNCFHRYWSVTVAHNLQSEKWSTHEYIHRL